MGSVNLASPGTAMNRLMSWEEAELGQADAQTNRSLWHGVLQNKTGFIHAIKNGYAVHLVFLGQKLHDLLQALIELETVIKGRKSLFCIEKKLQNDNYSFIMQMWQFTYKCHCSSSRADAQHTAFHVLTAKTHFSFSPGIFFSPLIQTAFWFWVFTSNSHKLLYIWAEITSKCIHHTVCSQA